MKNTLEELFFAQDASQVLASVRTTTVRPPFYFFGDSLGLLGVGENRQRETIEASLVFEEEEEGEMSKSGEEKEVLEDFVEDHDTIFVQKDETETSKKEPVVEAKELMMCESSQKAMSEGCNETTISKKVDALSPRCSGDQIISTRSIPTLSPELPPLPIPLAAIVKIDDQPSSLPTKNEELSLLLSTISGPPSAPSPPPAESGDSLTREQIIQIYTSSNSPDQSSV